MGYFSFSYSLINHDKCILIQKKIFKENNRLYATFNYRYGIMLDKTLDIYTILKKQHFEFKKISPSEQRSSHLSPALSMARYYILGTVHATLIPFKLRLSNIRGYSDQRPTFFCCGNSAADISKPHTFKWGQLTDEVLSTA